MTTRIQLDRSGPIATLWLDRPDKRNALDDAAMKAIAAALDELGADRATRVVIIRGKGPVFSSGIDHTLLVGVAAATQHTPFLHLHHQLQDVFHRMSRLHQPIIAAVHGACVGMALELALAADVRVASEDCVLGLPEIAFGLVPDVGGTTRLVRAVGEPRARELILTGRLLRARTAERYGLVHEVTESADALAARATAIAETMAQHSGTALGLAKSLCQAAGETDASTSFRFEGLVQQALIAQPDLPARFQAALAFIKAQVANPS
ncbi:MAG TPA: enoyl-CoA hydratase/isomerase family protein [Kofleriaceae bacterium]|nr:enoyl-CoA hydratase/isomerase family protein [Kofleriaceae bacterium]